MGSINNTQNDSKDITVKRINQTAGLISGYQRTNNTTLSSSLVDTTGGYLLFEVASLPWYSPSEFEEPFLEVVEQFQIDENEKISEGYKVMAELNNLLAEEFFPAITETWPLSEK